MTRFVIALATAAVAVLAIVPAAPATFQGENGKLAFIRYHPDENADLWTVNADGSGLRRLTDNEVFSGDSAYDSSPAWSPDGGEILFTRHRPIEGASGIFTINGDGSGLTQLDDFPGGAEWLPDGRVAFLIEGPAAGLYTVNADGTGRTRVGPAPDGGGISWSPDGTRIVYTGRTIYASSVWVSSIDGTGVRQIIEQGQYESPYPTWRPGPRIAFIRHGAAGGWDLFTIEPDGSGERRLTDDSAIDLEQQWSPDGTRLVFLSDRSGEPGDVFDLFTIAEDGSSLTNLTAASTGSDVDTAWSPDSRRVAFSGYEEDKDGLFTVDDTGQDRSRVTVAPVDEHDAMVDWQPLLRSSFRNAAAFCRAHRTAVGLRRFSQRYGKGRRVGAFGRCVSGEG